MSITDKKKKQRFTAASVILASFLVLAACSNSNNGAANEGAAGASSAPTADTAVRGKITSTIYERGGVPEEEGTKTENRWTKWINENGPVDISFVGVPRWESAQKLNTMFASGSAPDIIMEYDTVIKNQLYNQKQLLPLDEYIDKYSTVYKEILDKNPLLKKAGLKDDGKLYEIGKIGNAIPQHIMYIRTDWLNKLGLSMPKTTDEFFKVAQAFSEQDPDENGKKDTYGVNISFVGGMVVDDIFGTVFNTTNQNSWVLDDSGNLDFGWERIQSALEFKKKLFDAGIVDKDFLTDGKGDKALQDFVNGKLGIYGSNGSGVDPFKTLKANDPKATIAALVLPEGPYGSFSPLLSTPINMTTVVNAKAKDPEAIIKYIDFMMSEEATRTLTYGIEGEHYKIGDNGTPEVIDAAKNKTELSYNGDFSMILSGINDDWASYKLTLHPAKPADSNEADYAINKEFAEVYGSAFDAYLDPAKPTVGVISTGALPSLPQNLQINQTNGYKAINDILAKSIIGGNSYTAEQSIKDAQAAWKTSNGEAVEAWYKEWFTANKENILLTKDFYDYLGSK